MGSVYMCVGCPSMRSMRSFGTCFEELAVIIFLVLLLAVIEIAAGCRSSRPFAPFSNAEDDHALLYQTCGVLYMTGISSALVAYHCKKSVQYSDNILCIHGISYGAE